MVRIGIIGCGHWGPNFVRNFCQLSDVEVVAVCDKDSAKLKNIENMLADIQVYTDYQKILNDNT
ncbi:MAG: Gfo/Idh/MocA family oxidoreductase, partial [Candidatus Omnitrophota bacterium]